MRDIYVARGSRLDDVVAVENGQVLATGTTEQLAELLHAERAKVYTVDSTILVAVTEAYVQAGHFDRLDIALRGSGSVGVPAPLSIRCDGLPARWQDPTAQLPDSSLDELAEQLGERCQPALAMGGEARALWLSRVVQLWHTLTTEELGLALSVTLASTAAKIGIPRSWRNAHKALAHRNDSWAFVRSAYYGGRVHCPGQWEGAAVEYDLKSAYGWALSNPLPDWKIYDRKPLPRQPAWYDVTVRLTGDLGPLPVRDPEQTYRLTYPTNDTVRGVWTKEDLERSGVGVVTVHRVLSGRWSRDLAPAVEQWLSRRELVNDAARKALYRALANSLAGKLCQRSTGWALWTADNGEVPPRGAVPLAVTSSLWAVPVAVAREGVTCPQAGSYVTALVRSRMWPELSRPEVLYSDTDSIHLPESAPAPKNLGSAPGQFAEKHRGAARYIGPKHYQIGSKIVQPANFLRQFAPGQSRRKEREGPQF